MFDTTPKCYKCDQHATRYHIIKFPYVEFLCDEHDSVEPSPVEYVLL